MLDTLRQISNLNIIKRLSMIILLCVGILENDLRRGNMGIKKIEHTALIVKNLEESIEFYEKVLNFQLRTTANTGIRKLAFLFIKDHPEAEIELIEELTDKESPYINGVIDHIAFAVDNIEETIKDLKEKDVPLLSEQPNLTAAGKKTIMFKGINGELLQLIES